MKLQTSWKDEDSTKLCMYRYEKYKIGTHILAENGKSRTIFLFVSFARQRQNYSVAAVNKD